MSVNLRNLIDAEPPTTVIAQPAGFFTIDLGQKADTREPVGLLAFTLTEHGSRHALALPMSEVRRLYHDLGYLLEGESPEL